MATTATEEGPREVIIEGWGGKQGFHFPTWKSRYFVLEKKASFPKDTDDIIDARDYFTNSSDSYERAHNYNVETDKVHLVLTYYTDSTKAELKEEFHFDKDTYWVHQASRVTCPKYSQGEVKSIHLFCKGSRGAHKLIFIPFWGFVEPTFSLMCQPWVLSMEFGKPKCYDNDNGDGKKYYDDFNTVQEDVFGRQQKDWDARRDTFNAMFEDDEVFKNIKANPMGAAMLLGPIKFLGKNAQEDDLKKDAEDVRMAADRHTEWQMKFTKKNKELQVQKATAGSREAWLKLCRQAKHRNLKFDEWWAIKDKPGEMDSIPERLR